MTIIHSTILGTPSIIDGPENRIRREQDDVTFSCFATGDPPPSINWRFNGSILPENNKYSVGDIQDGRQFGSLTVRNLTYYDRGEYTCIVTNSIGSSDDSVVLSVQGIISGLLFAKLDALICT